MGACRGECLGLCNRSAGMGAGNTEAGNRLEREGRTKLIDWSALRSLEAEGEGGGSTRAQVSRPGCASAPRKRRQGRGWRDKDRAAR